MQMSVAQVSSVTLFDACRTIFGPQVNVSTEFLRYLQPIGVKSAFKKRALETHPDRAKQLGDSPRKLQEEFRTVKQAYELLLSYVENKTRRIVSDPGFTCRRARAPHTQNRQPRHTEPGPKRAQPYEHRRTAGDHFYNGPLPRRSLMFGQFLYYAGCISWRMLIEAISWQRMLRPCIGQMAMQSGILTQRDVVQVLSQRLLNERFGECAVRIGYMTPVQQVTLVSRQRGQQRRIGEYFVSQNVVSSNQLASLIERHRLHNSEAGPSARWAQQQ